MNSAQLHIYEEETNLFWAPVIVVTAAAAAWLLSDVFLSDFSALPGLKQLTALALLIISFTGIIKLSEPLYHFTFEVESNKLIVLAQKGERDVNIIEIPLNEIEALRFSPHDPRSSHEALFDFSINYHLMWKAKQDDGYRRLLDLGSASFVLRVDDIAKIIRFIRSRNPEIFVPEEQASFFNL